MKKSIITILAAALCSIVATAQNYADGPRISWDHSTQTRVTNGVYSRVKKLADGSLRLVYSTARGVYIRTKNPGDTRWGSGRRVAIDNSNRYDYTNAELIQLANGRLIYAWNARQLDRNGGTNPYLIMIATSDDLGATWSEGRTLFSAGWGWSDGCWEPAMLQLPSGEVQLYFANEYQIPNNNQEIAMMRSYDNGETWTSAQRVCFREGSRDGMPVPVYLQDDLGIVFAIEDNGLNGTFKPVIIRSSVEDNWSGWVDAASTNRWSALSSDCALAGWVYGGAPYLIQLTTGETLVSIQSGEGRENGGGEDHALMQVYVGDKSARNFCARSTPFPFAENPTPKVLWNALEQVDDNTVMATSSITGLPSGGDGVWVVEGTIMRPLTSISRTNPEDEWVEGSSSLFIGAESQANARVRSMWDNKNLYLRFDVKDDNVVEASDGAAAWDSDGVEFYYSRTQSSTAGLSNGQIKILVNVKGETLCDRFSNNVWASFSPKITHSVERTDDGYTILLTIPWSDLGSIPRLRNFTAHFKLHNNDGGSYIFHENLSGGNPDRSNTWFRVNLSSEESGADLLREDCAEEISATTYNLLGVPVDATFRGPVVRVATLSDGTTRAIKHLN